MNSPFNAATWKPLNLSSITATSIKGGDRRWLNIEKIHDERNI